MLRGAGIGLAIPFLPSLAPAGHAAVADDAGVKRLLILGTRYGFDQDIWFPARDTLDAAQAASAVAVSERGRVMPLSALEGDLSVIHRRSAWGSLVDKMTFVDGLDFHWLCGHESHAGLVGQHDEVLTVESESLDVILQSEAAFVQGTPMPVLRVATHEGYHNGSSLSVVRSGGTPTYLPCITDPLAAFNEVYSHVVDGAEAVAEFEARQHRDLSVIDRVYADYERTRGSARLSGTDRDRLDAYLQYLREYEQSLAAAEPVTCDQPAPPLDSKAWEPVVWSHAERAAAQIDTVVAALRCGVTNLATLWLMPNANELAFLGMSEPESNHGLSHAVAAEGANREAALADQTLIGRYMVDLVADVLRKLDVEEDPVTGRTFLDNTLVLWTNDMGSFTNHKGGRFPVMMFGARDLIRAGQYVDFRSDYERVFDQFPATPSIRPGVFYNRLLETLAQTYGLTPEQYEQTGEPGFGVYRLSSYYASPFPGGEEEYAAYAFGDRRTPLTELFEDGVAFP